jgi:ADP-heptose:LPS heptosyltransferase
MKTSLLTWMAAKACHAQTLGIAQFPGRSWFYDQTSDSVPIYAMRHGLSLPMDYTHRDFVVLQALALERHGTPIELQLTVEGEQFKQQLLPQLPAGLAVVGLNIGCGTQDALVKRPNLHHLAQCMAALYQQQSFTLVLSGAPFEQDVNQSFIEHWRPLLSEAPVIFDMAGQTTLPESAGLIDACDLFITTDSGPYHMAVGLRKPTLVWFTYAESTSFHEDAWVRRVIQPKVAEFVATAGQMNWLKNRPRSNS